MLCLFNYNLGIKNFWLDKIYYLVLVITHSSHAITQDISLIETAKAAEFFLTDGIIVTGTATGQPAEPQEVVGK